MQRVAAALILTLVSSPVAAQSVAGIRFGDTLESVRPRYPGTYAPIEGRTDVAFINREDGYIWFCHGRVTSMQETIGRDLHAFTDTLVEMTSQLGEPLYTATNVHTRSGEISTLEAKWQLDGYDLSIGYLFSEGRLNVTRTYSVQDSCSTE